MTSEQDLEVHITADPSGAKAGMNEAAEAVKHSAEEMKEHAERIHEAFEKVQGIFEKIPAAFAMVTAALAGGEAFEEAIKDTDRFIHTQEQLMLQLGASAAETSALTDALETIGVSQETYLGVTQRLTMSLRTNEDSFKGLGVRTREANGELRSTNDIMIDTLKNLEHYKAGTDRNLMAMRLLGRGYADAAELLKMQNINLEEAAQHQAALGLVVTQENIKMRDSYKAAMNDVHDVMDSIAKVIGETMIPRLTSLATSIGELGVPAFEAISAVMETYSTVADAVGEVVSSLWGVFKEVFSGIGDLLEAVFGTSSVPMTGMDYFRIGLLMLEDAILIVKAAIVAFVEIVKGAFTVAGEYIATFAVATERVLHLDFSGANEAWKTGMADIANTVVASYDKIKAETQKTQGQMEKAAERMAESSKSKGTQATITQGDKGAEADITKSIMSQLQQRLADKRLYYETNNNLAQFSKEQELAYWQEVLTTQKLNTQDRIAVEKQVSAAKLAVMKKEADDRRKLREEDINAAQRNAMAEISIEEARADAEVANGTKTQDERLKQKQQFEQRRYDIAVQYQQQRIALTQGDPNADPVALQKQKDQLLAIEQKHAIDVQKLHAEASQAAIKDWEGTLTPISNAFATSVQGMILQTTTWQKAMNNIFVSVLGEFISLGVKMGVHWAATQLGMTAASKAGDTARTVSQNATLAEQKAVEKVAAYGTIGTDAAVAGAGAAAQSAGYAGYGAVAIGAATQASVLGFAATVPAAAKGFDIPAGVNPLTQLHEKEMVLPANLADAVRSMADGKASTQPSVVIQVSAMDAKSFQQSLENGPLQKALQNIVRNFQMA